MVNFLRFFFEILHFYSKDFRGIIEVLLSNIMLMQIILKGKNMNIPDKVQDHATSKLNNLEKFIPQTESLEILAEVELGLRSRHHKKGDVYRAEINLTIDGNLHRSVSKKSDLHEAFDTAYSGIERQVRRDKNKQNSLIRRGARRAKRLLTGWRS